MSGFKLKLGGSQFGKFADYTHVLDVLFAKTCRLLWSATDAPGEAGSDNGIVYSSGGIGMGPGAIGDPVDTLTGATVGEQYSAGSQGLDVEAHGLDIEQGYVAVVTDSDVAGDIGYYHVSGYFTDEIILSAWLAGTTVDVSFYKDVSFIFDQGKTEAIATITDTGNGQAFGHCFNTFIERGSSTGGTQAFLVRVGGAIWPNAKFGDEDKSNAFGVYRCWWHDGMLMNVHFDGTAHIHRALGIGCEDPDGCFDVTATDPYSTRMPSYPFPRMTTVQREALTGVQDGAFVYDTTLHELTMYRWDTWVKVPWETI